jgi:hypothetical protein
VVFILDIVSPSLIINKHYVYCIPNGPYPHWKSVPLELAYGLLWRGNVHWVFVSFCTAVGSMWEMTVTFQSIVWPSLNVLTDLGSMYKSFIKKNPTRCNNVSKFYYSIFIWSSTCFGRHAAHQEPKTALATSGFSYVEGCWTCRWWTLSGHYLHVQQPSTYEKPEAASAVLGSWWWAVCRPKHEGLSVVNVLCVVYVEVSALGWSLV